MSTSSDVMPDASPASAPPSSAARTRPRPLYWSVRRELWENQAIWIAPLAVAAVIICGMMIAVFAPHHTTASTVHRTGFFTTQGVTQNPPQIAGPGDIPGFAPPPAVGSSDQAAVVAKAPSKPMTPAQRRAMSLIPFNIVAVALIFTMFMVSVFYCLGAMFNERRDRSILFWKSLPVPDVTTVAAKLIVPMAILPLVTLVVTVGTQLLMLLIGVLDLAAHGKDPGLATSIPLGEMSLVLLYGLTTLTLWWAPVYGWLLLVSGWAKRAPFLWATLPLLALAIGEKLAFNTNHIGNLIVSRLGGNFEEAFGPVAPDAVKAGLVPIISLSQIDAGKFFSSPGLWVGLVVAAGLLAATVWLRREREPI